MFKGGPKYAYADQIFQTELVRGDPFFHKNWSGGTNSWGGGGGGGGGGGKLKYRQTGKGTMHNSGMEGGTSLRFPLADSLV